MSRICSASAGHVNAHTEQLMHAAGRGSQGKGPAMAKQSVGHISQHRPQPVHLVSSR